MNNNMINLTISEFYYAHILVAFNNNKYLNNLHNCDKCINCLDKPRNGGIGKRKQTCILKKYSKKN